jgi:hypothetical protein
MRFGFMPDEEATDLDEIGPADDSEWLRPPKNIKNAAAWDRYWQNQVDHV